MNTTVDSLEYKNVTEMTSEPERYNIKVHSAIITCTIIIVCWTLLANTVIIICYITNRKKVWPAFVAQIFCLSLGDFFVGLVTLPWLLFPIFKTDDWQVSYISCCTMLYLLLCSQCGSLYHMMTICAYRLFRIETSTKIIDTNSNKKAPFCFAVTAWVASFIMCSLPFFFWADNEGTLNACLLQEIFVDITKAMGVLVIILFLPQVLTNILYIVVCLRLRYLWRRIHPVQSDGSASVTNDASTSSSGGYSRTNVRIQRRFMGTIGFVMLLYNICTLPVIFLVFLENDYHVTKRNFRYTACMFFILNSALNPFIYALRSPWLKEALKRMYRNWCDCFICL